MIERIRSTRERLASPEPEIRRLATQDIALLPAPDSCDLLMKALGDEDWRVRKEAANVASRIEPRTAVVFALGHGLAEQEHVGLRNAAVEALVLIGPDAVPAAIDALGRLDADGRKLAVEVLAGAPTLGGVRALARATLDSDLNVVVAAAEGLGRANLAGDEARDLAKTALEQLVDRAELQVRLAALESLNRLGVSMRWSRIEPLLAEPLLRRPALTAAGMCRAPRAVLAMAEACADPNPAVSREAVVALGRIVEESWDDEATLEVAARTLRASPHARTRLRAVARDASDVQARGAAVLALGLVRDPDDVSLIVDAMADDAVTDRGEMALRIFGHEAVEPLIMVGRTAAPSLRGATLSMIPQLAPQESEPLAAVREALSDAAPEVVAPALKSIAIVGGPEDLEVVARHVESSDAKVAVAAHAALLAIASRHPAAARAMLTDVDPRSDGTLWASVVVDALARIGASRPVDAAFLAVALTHREASVRRAAIEALASLGGPEAAEAVTFCLADEEDVVANAAIRALGRLGRAEQLASLAATTRDPIRLATVLRALRDADPVRTFAAARPLLRSRESAVAAAAVEVIGSIPTPGRVEALMGATDHPDHEVVKLALAQLASTSDERAFAALVHAVDHQEEAVRKYAAELLGEEGSSEAEGMLRARLDRERSAEVRRSIMEALGGRPAGEGQA